MTGSVLSNSLDLSFESNLWIDISIPLRFNGRQPNAFGVDPATAKPLGDTRTGSSVNYEQYTFIPHCSGTHTECVGHITHQRISVRDCLQDVIIPAYLISAEPLKMAETGELEITRRSVETALSEMGAASGTSPKALIIRTLPNDDRKLTAEYGEQNIPPYFSPDAVQLIVDFGFKHLLCDLPSIDRIYDEGKLINHRIFWNVEEGSCEINEATRIDSTITELIYVPNEVEDGEYLLNLQIAPFESDCAPSRPVLIHKTER
ncbi:MAG: cyclase family protein [Chloracidobacterium sp.]|nr:cyclase family protein [Chloracidobacterium sp.]